MQPSLTLPCRGAVTDGMETGQREPPVCCPEPIFYANNAVDKIACSLKKSIHIAAEPASSLHVTVLVVCGWHCLFSQNRNEKEGWHHRTMLDQEQQRKGDRRFIQIQICMHLMCRFLVSRQTPMDYGTVHAVTLQKTAAPRPKPQELRL